MSLALSIVEEIRPLVFTARQQETEIGTIEDALRKDYDRLCCANWRLGQTLCALKEKIGHSRWLIWLGGNLPSLAGDDGRRAQRIMALYRDNDALSNPSNLTDLTVDSVRRFLGGYLPAKIRPQLEDNQKLAPIATFDGVTNRFTALLQRIKSQHATPAPLDQVAPQVKLIIGGLREIYGREPIDALLS